MSAVDLALHANPARSWTRLDGVDLLRGLAIFFVLMNHVNMRLMAAKVPYTAGLPRELVSCSFGTLSTASRFSSPFRDS
jgi:uncharacterized membrane protein